MKRRITAEQFIGDHPPPIWVDALAMIVMLGLVIGAGLLVAVLVSEVWQ